MWVLFWVDWCSPQPSLLGSTSHLLPRAGRRSASRVPPEGRQHSRVTLSPNQQLLDPLRGWEGKYQKKLGEAYPETLFTPRIIRLRAYL